MHDHKVSNRDIKIDNIVVSTQYPKDECCKIIDFSTARNAEKDSTFFDCAGTPGFRAPEV